MLSLFNSTLDGSLLASMINEDSREMLAFAYSDSFSVAETIEPRIKARDPTP